jgi:hypothetical protein
MSRSVRSPCLALFGGLMWLVAAHPARAQVMGEPADPYPDPDKFARGLFVQADLGAVLFLGEARKPLGPGAALGARVGVDLTRWLAFQARGRLSSHQTDFATGPQSGQLLQILAASAEVKISVPLGQWIPFAFGGGGFGRLSTNLLGTTGLTAPDLRHVVLIGGGAGIDYHPRSRHFTFGLEAGFTRMARLRSPGLLSGTTHLRYTF